MSSEPKPVQKDDSPKESDRRDRREPDDREDRSPKRVKTEDKTGDGDVVVDADQRWINKGWTRTDKTRGLTACDAKGCGKRIKEGEPHLTFNHELDLCKQCSTDERSEVGEPVFTPCRGCH